MLWLKSETKIKLIWFKLFGQMLSQNVESPEPMRYSVLQLFIHLTVSLVIAWWLEARVPAERAIAPWLNYLAFNLTSEHRHNIAVIIGHRTDSGGALVFPAGQQSMQTVRTQVLQKPFDVRTGKSAQGFETNRV